MRVLSIDTALTQCAACVLDVGTGTTLAMEAMELERGHAEALLPLLDRVIARVEGGFASLDRVAVTVGPGSFTGLRVGISAARAIGLATGKPVVGVTTLSALIAPFLGAPRFRLVASVIDARGGRVYAQALAPSGRTVIKPSLLPVKDVVRALGTGAITLLGSGGPIVAAEAWAVGLDARVDPSPPVPDIAWVAQLGAVADPANALPKPFYLAAPDARPQDAARLPRL